jgi:ankyrin repeat protein
MSPDDELKALMDAMYEEYGAGDDFKVTPPSRKHSRVIRDLIERGASLGTRSERGETVLMAAAWCGDVGPVRDLISRGCDADVHARSYFGETPESLSDGRGWKELSHYLRRYSGAED